MQEALQEDVALGSHQCKRCIVILNSAVYLAGEAKCIRQPDLLPQAVGQERCKIACGGVYTGDLQIVRDPVGIGQAFESAAEDRFCLLQPPQVELPDVEIIHVSVYECIQLQDSI